MTKTQHIISSETITTNVAPDQQILLQNPANWSAATSTNASYYIGTALTGNNQLDEWFDGLYLYRFIADNIPVRIKCD